MQKKYQLMTVTKSHWDREWYMDYQKTRIRLIHLIDTVLELVENDRDFVSFMLDAQTLPLEDYLEVKPENFDRIKKAIQAGRIIIGPWYILPDEVLITGEAHIRNYLLGSRIAKKFGAKKMEIGYLPDSFGHPSQMPQIIRGLGMDAIMFWRGATAEIKKNEFNWVAPDGTKVLAVLMPEGYSTGCELADDPQLVAARFDEYIDKMSGRSLTDIIYLSNGGDHLEPKKTLSKLLPEVNRYMQRGSVTHTTLEHFIEELKNRINVNELQDISGELWGAHTAILLGSTLSTRTYLKQMNHKASGLLENYLEPMFTMAARYGYEYPREILIRAWKYLMENQPHDSICGCSIDQVHKDMIFRFDQIFEIGGALQEELAGFFRTVIDSRNVKGSYAVAVFNTFSGERSGEVEVSVDVDPRPTACSDYRSFDENGKFPIRIIDNSEDALKPLPKDVRVYDGEKEIPAKLVDASVENLLITGYEHFPHQYNVNRMKIVFRAEQVPAIGWKVFGIEPLYEKAAGECLETPEIENEYFIVSVSKDGTLNVTDKENNKKIEGLNRLVDSGDCGDEYTYCPPENDQMIEADPDSVRVEKIEANEVRQTIQVTGIMRIPRCARNRFEGRSDETADCAFKSIITLYKGKRSIDIHTEIDNRASDHRLRVVFPVGCFAEMSQSAGTFSVDSRPVHPEVDPEAMEICKTNMQKDFCDAGNKEYGVAVANRGLREYEAYDDENGTVLAVTLLRCTGLISQRRLATRPCKGGWSEKTPDAQCIGTWEFDYSIIPHKGTWEEAEVYVDAHSFNFPVQAIQLDRERSGNQKNDSFVRVDSRAMICTAVKKAEFEETYIVRMYNSTAQTIRTSVHFCDDVKQAATANLREDTIRMEEMHDHAVEIEAAPFEIVTLKMKL